MKPFGKRVADEFYVHLSALDQVDDETAKAKIQHALDHFPGSSTDTPNVAKLNVRNGRVSLLAYPHFFDDPFPSLSAAWSFPPGASAPEFFRSYAETLNPPILHRKELLVGPTHPQFPAWCNVTSTAEQLGLFDEPSTIGFRLNWTRLLESKGYCLVGDAFLPIGNDISAELSLNLVAGHGAMQRHRTALSRTSLSAPVQLLARHGFLDSGATFFDYGCGRGDDVAGLRTQGVEAAGWDPHYQPDAPLEHADVINLGFVINVIEDPVERVEALNNAFRLAREVLAVSVMLHASRVSGKPYRDGFVTSRETFQKYFSQSELKDFIEDILHRDAIMVGPGVAFVFSSYECEQRFAAGRFRNHRLAERLLIARGHKPRALRPAVPRTPPPSLSKSELESAAVRPHLDRLWATALDLGRLPEPDEILNPDEINAQPGGLSRALRLLRTRDQNLLAASAATRSDDVRVLMAAQQFAKRTAYRYLEPRLQRDIKAFFGDYRAAQEAGLRLLLDAAEPAMIMEGCRRAAMLGLGWLEADQSLQLHASMVERLPAVLRAYVAAGLILWEALSDVQLIKIHVASGKLTLMEFADFDEHPLPSLRRRIKVNLRRLDYELFEYGTPEHPMPLLYRKSRFLHEDYPGFAEQLAFDEMLEKLGVPGESAFGPSPSALASLLEANRLEIDGFQLRGSTSIPALDNKCGQRLTYRQLIECGETQQRFALKNLPLNPKTYNALFDLATQILDPVIEYFGSVRLTYGFASAELVRHIDRRIAPRLDQHAACEHSRMGKPICERGGAACDFLVEDEDMYEVAQWIQDHLAFDRLYFYGNDCPIHVSYSPTPARQAFTMTTSPTGRLIPRPF